MVLFVAKGLKVVEIVSHIQIPRRRVTPGRIMNVIGKPLDECSPIECVTRIPTQSKPTAFVEKSTTPEVLETSN